MLFLHFWRCCARSYYRPLPPGLIALFTSPLDTSGAQCYLDTCDLVRPGDPYMKVVLGNRVVLDRVPRLARRCLVAFRRDGCDEEQDAETDDGGRGSRD